MACSSPAISPRPLLREGAGGDSPLQCAVLPKANGQRDAGEWHRCRTTPTWSRYAARIAPQDKPLPAGWTKLRLDLPLTADRVLQVRNLKLRPERPGEFDTTAAKPSAAASKEALQAYLDRKFPAAITQVTIGKG